MSPNHRTDGSWLMKFSHAFRGVKLGVRGQSSFFVHFFATALVVAAAVVLGANLVEWCLLTLSITMVLAAEMFNSGLEWLAKAITEEHDERIGKALDIGSGAVLLASIGAVVVGAAIFGHRLIVLLEW